MGAASCWLVPPTCRCRRACPRCLLPPHGASLLPGRHCRYGNFMQKGIELAKEAVEEDNKQNWTQVSGPGAQCASSSGLLLASCWCCCSCPMRWEAHDAPCSCV